MKKIIFLAIGLFFGFNQVLAGDASSCADFPAGQMCVKIKNLWAGQYRTYKTFSASRTGNISIRCQILTPDGKLKNWGMCEGVFDYVWTGKHDVKFYVEVEWVKKVITIPYNFFNLTKSEYEEINAVYKKWPKLVTTLESEFPALQTNDTFAAVSDVIYEQMWNLLYWRKTKISSYNHLKQVLIAYVQYVSKLVR